MSKKRFKKPVVTALIMALMFTTLLCNTGLVQVFAATVSFTPTEINDVLYNPYMGWMPLANQTNYSQKHTMVLAPLTWKELEPTTRGVFDWAGFESRNNFSYWQSKGVKINIRFYLDYPTSTAHRDIPDWLYNNMGVNKGTAYNSVDIGQGFSPNYSDSYLIQEHSRVIAALGARYNSDSRIAFIQLGSLGHWGEWHAWPYSPSTGVFPLLSVSNQYVQHYINAFSTDKLCMRRGYQMAKDNYFGLFNDMFGDTASLDSPGWGWLYQINNGYTDDFGQTHPSMPDFWKYGPAGGEFAYGNAEQYVTDATINETVRQATTSHTSWLGPCSPIYMAQGCADQDNLDRLMKTMGYRFVLKNTTHSKYVNSGTNLAVTMTWENKGVAPFYFQWPLGLALANSSGNIVTYTTTNEDIRNWLPGTRTITKDLTIPTTITPGTYKLLVSLIDPATNNPGIDLAIGGKRTDGWYALDNVIVSKNITIDGNASDWSNISPITTAVSQSSTSLKVTSDEDYIYLCAQGSNLGPNGQFFINSDNNSATGYVNGIWTNSGCDYLIESGYLYSHPANSNDWSWTNLGSTGVTVSSNSTIYEVKIKKTSMTNLGGTIRVGFQDLNSSWGFVSSLPVSGTLPSYVLP